MRAGPPGQAGCSREEMEIRTRSHSRAHEGRSGNVEADVQRGELGNRGNRPEPVLTGRGRNTHVPVDVEGSPGFSKSSRGSDRPSVGRGPSCSRLGVGSSDQAARGGEAAGPARESYSLENLLCSSAVSLFQGRGRPLFKIKAFSSGLKHACSDAPPLRPFSSDRVVCPPVAAGRHDDHSAATASCPARPGPG